MKRIKFFSSIIIISFIALLSLIGCGPYAEIFEIEIKQSPKVEIEFDNKTIAIFTTIRDDSFSRDNLYWNDSLLMLSFANGLARSLEINLDLPEETVFVFNHKADSLELSREYIYYLANISNSDLLFVVNSLVLKDISINTMGMYNGNVIYSIDIYDGILGAKIENITKNDKVYWDSSSADLAISDIIPNIITIIGENFSQSLFVKWVTQSRFLYSFPNNLWQNSINNAIEFNWESAMNYWMTQLEDPNPSRVAAAAFNLAVACEMTERYDLAIEWLEFSLSRSKLQGVEEYKKDLLNRIEKK